MGLKRVVCHMRANRDTFEPQIFSTFVQNKVSSRNILSFRFVLHQLRTAVRVTGTPQMQLRLRGVLGHRVPGRKSA